MPALGKRRKAHLPLQFVQQPVGIVGRGPFAFAHKNGIAVVLRLGNDVKLEVLVSDRRLAALLADGRLAPPATRLPPCMPHQLIARDGYLADVLPDAAHMVVERLLQHPLHDAGAADGDGGLVGLDKLVIESHERVVYLIEGLFRLFLALAEGHFLAEEGHLGQVADGLEQVGRALAHRAGDVGISVPPAAYGRHDRRIRGYVRGIVHEKPRRLVIEESVLVEHQSVDGFSERGVLLPLCPVLRHTAPHAVFLDEARGVQVHGLPPVRQADGLQAELLVRAAVERFRALDEALHHPLRRAADHYVATQSFAALHTPVHYPLERGRQRGVTGYHVGELVQDQGGIIRAAAAEGEDYLLPARVYGAVETLVDRGDGPGEQGYLRRRFAQRGLIIHVLLSEHLADERRLAQTPAAVEHNECRRRGSQCAPEPPLFPFPVNEFHLP